ncbi:MAG: GNAT family N-acetyltransferase [Chromatiaceae bacterium]|nr:MAG: GNAT family N-acetyltransferase [Chromatiaceae bacterium]
MRDATHRTPAGVIKTLANGQRYLLRPPRPEDKARVADCFARLSEESRRRRFFAAKKTITERELDFFTLADGDDHIAVAALALDPAGQEVGILGMARCLRHRTDREAAELALAVADEAQHNGLGRAMVEQLLGPARGRGIRRLELETLMENRPMQALAQRYGGVGHRTEDGLLHYVIQLPPAPAAEVVSALIPELVPAWAPTASGVAIWPWSNAGWLLDAMHQDWIDVAETALLLSRDLNDRLWEALWESWLPGPRAFDRTPA